MQKFLIDANWRAKKLAAYPINADALMVALSGALPSRAELQQLKHCLDTYNMVFYRLPTDLNNNKAVVHTLAQQLGLKTLDANWCADADSLSAIEVTHHRGQHDYIPYTNKALSWHTDGYYNAPERQIRGMLLHCVRPGLSGGENSFMDPEMAYLLLAEANPAYIEALQHPEALTIPANILNGAVIRPAQTGPVFSFDSSGHLHMRYSARQKNIQWRNEAMTQAAAEFLLNLWQQSSPYIIRYRFQAGEGVLCNNVLHNRSAFQDTVTAGETRLLYRGRYLERAQINLD